jgi:TolB protein
MNINKVFIRLYVAIVLLLAFMAGCSVFSGNNTPPNANSHSLGPSLYGRLDGWKPVNFEANPFSSLIQHTYCQEGGDYDPDVSSDSKWLVYSSLRDSPNPDIYIKQTNGATVTRLTSDPASEIQPSFSPKDDKVAYTSNRSGSWDIWVIGVDGSNPTQLTSGPGDDIRPSWSPDGKHIVYSSYGPRSSQWELWIVSTENPGMKKWIGYGYAPAWNPNPKTPKIAFQLPRYRGSQWFSIWTVDYVDGEAKYPTLIVGSASNACICPAWSPDGSKIAYSTVSRTLYEKTKAGNNTFPGNAGEDIWIVDLDGRNNLQLTQSDASNFSPTWSSDGRVFFCSDRKQIENIWSIKPYQVDFKQEATLDLSQHPQTVIKAN